MPRWAATRASAAGCGSRRPAGRPGPTTAACRSWPGPGLALLELRLETGRTHQIRVHLAAIGHPIVADRRYGRDDGLAPRTFLHAARLRFTHPITGHEVVVESPLPADLDGALGRLGEPAGA